MSERPEPFARKDGYYHDRFTRPEILRLRRTRPDLVDEICLVRVFLHRLASALDGIQTYVDDDLKMFAAMTALSRAVGTLVRYQVMINRPGDPLDRAVTEALKAHNERWRLS
jgi:hypothetical protein